MGYPKGEIPMLDVHGQAVAGATFPVPIWHEYMAAALWRHKALGFELPNQYPTWHYLTHGSYGSFGYYPTTTYTTTTTATTTTSAAATRPSPTTVATKPTTHTTTPAPPPRQPTTPAAPTTAVPTAPTTTASPPPSPGQVP